MEIKNLKHEVKQSISLADYRVLKQMLHTMSQNQKGTFNINSKRVHSLSFENMDDNLQVAKNSEKFSIRYQNEDTSVIKLEKKSKRKDCCLVRTAFLTQRECERIIAGDFEFLGASEDPLLFEFYNRLKAGEIRPRILVDFTRETFTLGPGNMGVTFDSEFCTGFNISDFLNEKHPTIKRTQQIIMEVKYDKYLPEVISRIINGDRDIKSAALTLALHKA